MTGTVLISAVSSVAGIAVISDDRAVVSAASIVTRSVPVSIVSSTVGKSLISAVCSVNGRMMVLVTSLMEGIVVKIEIVSEPVVPGFTVLFNIDVKLDSMGSVVGNSVSSSKLAELELLSAIISGV